MAAELFVVVIVEALDGGVLDRAVHPFDLAIGPGVPDLGEAVLDPVLFAAHVEHVCYESCCRAVGVARREGELDAPRHCLSDQWRSNGSIGEDGVDLVGNRLDQRDEEGRGGDPVGLFLQPEKGKFARAVNGYEEVELAFGGLHLSDVDVEVADRVALELLLRGDVARDLRQARDVMALQAAMQRRAAQMRDPSPWCLNQWRTMARSAMNKGNRPAARACACGRRR